jgi:hypothetical protein
MNDKNTILKVIYVMKLFHTCACTFSKTEEWISAIQMQILSLL